MHRSMFSDRAVRCTSLLLLAALALVAAVAVTGCSSGSGSGYGMMKTGAGTASKPATGGKMAMTAESTGTTDPSVQTCAVCDGKGKGKTVEGTATIKDGVQIVSIAIQGGYYVPNKITLKAGMPVQVVFTGKSKGCIAHPTFKSLSKSGDLTSTGTATIDLGTLKAGTYGFACAMGMSDGAIIAQ